MTMTDVACFCGCVYSFHEDVGVCPRCGEYASLSRTSVEAEQQMRYELALLIGANHGSPPNPELRLSADRRAT